MEKITKVLAIALLMALPLAAQDKKPAPLMAHVRSIEQEKIVGTSRNPLFDPPGGTVTTRFYDVYTVECGGKIYKIMDTGGWSEHLEVGKDYQVLKISKDRMDLLVQRVVKTHWNLSLIHI